MDIDGAGAAEREGVQVLRRALRTRDVEEIARARELLGEVLNTAVLTDDVRSRVLGNLAAAHHAQFGQTGEIRSLVLAVAARTEALRLSSSANPQHPTRLSLLSASLRARFETGGRREDLERALVLGRQAVEAAEGDAARLPALYASLSSTLRVHYEKGGDLAHLDESITLGRAAAEGAAVRQDERSGYLTNLSIGLRDRYLHRGHAADIDDAVSAAREALAATPPEHPGRARRLSNLGLALRSRHIRTMGQDVLAPVGQPPVAELARRDIDEAVATFREAAALSNDSRTSWRMSNVAAALLTRHEVTHAATDVDEAVAFARRAVATSEPSGTDLAVRLNNVAYALTKRASVTGDLTDVDEAIRVGTRVLELEPPIGANRAMYMNNIGLAHRARFEITQDTSSARRAIQMWRQVVEAPVSMTRERLAAAQRWVELAEVIAPGSTLALDGYAAAVGLLPTVPWRGIDRQSRQRFLLDRTGLGSDAVACAVAAARPDLAAQLEEVGRGVLWSQLLDIRADLVRLAGHAPAFASRLQEIRAELDPIAHTRQ